MIRFKYSLIYGLLIIATTPFHYTLERILGKAGMLNLVSYFLLGVLLALFLIALFKSFGEKRIYSLAALGLVLLVLTYLLFSKRFSLGSREFAVLLHVAEFFFMGFLLFMENRGRFSFMPFIILALMAVGFEAIQLAFPGRVFDIRDIWVNGIAGFCGMIVGYF